MLPVSPPPTPQGGHCCCTANKRDKVEGNISTLSLLLGHPNSSVLTTTAETSAARFLLFPEKRKQGRGAEGQNRSQGNFPASFQSSACFFSGGGNSSQRHLQESVRSRSTRLGRMFENLQTFGSPKFLAPPFNSPYTLGSTLDYKSSYHSPK